jgi:PncC family amidohydrolase
MLEERAGELLRRNGKTLSLAESCTGGLIASLVTDVPGSSDYFLLSLVTYSNASKMKLLGVPPEMLDEHGAVSGPVAQAMAAGARRAGGADIGLSVTGIAGPSGGTPRKPIGLVFFCLDDGAKSLVDRRVFSGDRLAVKRQAAEHALTMLCAHLE